jgi:uncharacterized protein (TIGR04255 family)
MNSIPKPFPQLSRPPIVEGLIDFHVQPRENLVLSDVARFRDGLIARYPVSKEMKEHYSEVRVSAENEASQSVKTQSIGFRLERGSPPFVVIARLSGLTVSRLHPYSDWDELVNESKLIWDAYVQACQPSTVTRIATRFINRILLPAPNSDLDVYLTVLPKIPRELPDLLAEFLVRLVIPHPACGATVILTEALEAMDREGGLPSVLIDIDAFKLVELEPASVRLWEHLQVLRNLKNDAFFGTITPTTLELLK